MTIKELTFRLAQKKVAVLGLGEEGLALAVFLCSLGIRPTLLDESPVVLGNEVLSSLVKKYKLIVITESGVFKRACEFDLIFRSPGISLIRSELRAAARKGVEISSQTKLFFDLVPCPIIGVTGTKGKGTTATLIADMLKQAIRTNEFSKSGLIAKSTRVFLTGNIGGIPPLSFISKLRPSDVVVFELSSFQLEDLKVSPHIAVVLMIVPAHLDYNQNHKTLAQYVGAKSSITRYQTKKDCVIYNSDYELSRQIALMSPGEKVPAQVIKGEEQVLIRKNMLVENFRAAAWAAIKAGVSPSCVIEVGRSFKGLPHRLQLVARRKGVVFYNDSLSTIPEASVRAVKQFSEPVILILGGTSTVKSYKPLTLGLSECSNLKNILLIGSNREIIARELAKKSGLQKLIVEGGKNMAEVFKRLGKIAAAGDVVLLSPASASLDMFKNYKERGQEFTKFAQKF